MKKILISLISLISLASCKGHLLQEYTIDEKPTINNHIEGSIGFLTITGDTLYIEDSMLVVFKDAWKLANVEKIPVILPISIKQLNGNNRTASRTHKY